MRCLYSFLLIMRMLFWHLLVFAGNGVYVKWKQQLNLHRLRFCKNKKSVNAFLLKEYQKMRLLVVYIFLLTSSAAPISRTTVLKGKAVKIIDGDTFDLLVGTTVHRIRLAGIDAPERKQDFSSASKQILGQLCTNQLLTVVVTDVDRNKRKIADVYDAKKKWINKELILQGMAWHFKQYSSNRELANAELLARKKKIGLWSFKNPVAPWEWRKGKR